MIKRYGLLDPTIDFVFKKIFGDKDHREPLVSLLNAILDGNPTIRDVTLKNTELDKNYPEDKFAKLDVYAVTDNGVYLDIEIQRRDTEDLADRSVYYMSKLVTDCTDVGKKYNETKAISIWIMKERIHRGPFSARKSAKEEILMCARPTAYDDKYEPYSTKGRIILLFLDKIENDIELNRKLKTWMQFLSTPALVDNPDNDQGLVQARKKLDYVSADDDTRLAIDRVNMAEIAKNSEEYAHNMYRYVPIAKNFMALGIPFKDIAKSLQFDEDLLQRMINTYDEEQAFYAESARLAAMVGKNSRKQESKDRPQTKKTDKNK